MKNVLHVVNVYFVIPYFLGDQLIHFFKKGYKEYIICSPSEEIKQYSNSHHFFYKEVPVLRKISLFKDVEAVLLICAYIKSNKIDVVTGHTPKGALLSMIAAYIMRVPIRLYFRHGLVYETSFGLKRFLLISMDRLSAKLSTRVVCVSPSVYKKSLCDKLNIERKQVLLSKGTCNGIDLKQFSRDRLDLIAVEKLREKLSIPKDSFVVGFVGRLVKDKGIIELVDAFQDIQKKKLNVILLLVGMLEVRDALPLEIVDRINNSQCIVCTGCVDNNNIQLYYALMDVFVLPSYREGFPTSVLEASSMGLPVVTTKATGCVDSIISQETGLFVEHNKLDIINAIEFYMNNSILRKEHGDGGRKFVESNFEQHIVWSEIEKLYKE